MYSGKQRLAVSFFVVIFLLLQAISANAACYSDTETFDPGTGIFWNYPWSHTVSDLPSGFMGDSATIEIKVKVWALGPYPGRLDILCSDTNAFYAGNSNYLVGSLNLSTNPNASTFYTIKFSLKPNQIEWLTNDKNLNFMMVANGGTYYLDYCKLTVCSSVTITYALTLQVNGNGTTTPGIGVHSYVKGKVVNLSAVPDKGWRFINWTGDVADRKSAITTVTMNGNKIVVANFSRMNLPPLMLLLNND